MSVQCVGSSHPTVHRQGFGSQWQREPKESLAHLVILIMQRAGGDDQPQLSGPV
jgi:hypothetical protein